MQVVVQGRARVLVRAGREAVGVDVEERDESRVPGPMALTVRHGRLHGALLGRSGRSGGRAGS